MRRLRCNAAFRKRSFVQIPASVSTNVRYMGPPCHGGSMCLVVSRFGEAFSRAPPLRTCAMRSGKTRIVSAKLTVCWWHRVCRWYSEIIGLMAEYTPLPFQADRGTLRYPSALLLSSVASAATGFSTSSIGSCSSVSTRQAREILCQMG